RRYEGEVNLLVWCAWRLDSSDGPLTSWDDAPDRIRAQLARLQGIRVRAASAVAPTWDLSVSFWNGLKLRVFCDHVPDDPSFDGNWELWRTQDALVVGPGARVEIVPRSTNSPSELRSTPTDT